ncbi:Aspartic proteinase CDR1 [Morella rubra]|uniref:Aspartic proteinase CDR1 n=1 Tax=Morella rubra TaxID=262757 RepID=A0A6A1WN78_9ROSI|nr:Aspartic proteinase CDR1 [Morella rubra]
MASHHCLLYIAALATTLPVLVLICSFSLTQALNGGFSVDLIHRDSPASPFYDPTETPSQRIAKALRRSFNRVDHFKPASVVSSAAPPSEIVPNKGEYLLTAVLTGCYRQTAPLFSPLKSTTYKKVDCPAKQCKSLHETSCSSKDGSDNCQYEVSYGDGSFSKGDLAIDTLTLGSSGSQSVSLPNIAIGCGHNNDGTFDEKSSGIVGLGGGASSLVSQLGPDSTGGKFSYCLLPFSHQGNMSSKLCFGSEAVVSGSGAVSTPLVSKSQETFYFLTLEAMSVGDVRLESGDSSLSGDSKGNIIIDSGTTLTLLPKDFYSEFEAAVKKQIDLERDDRPRGGLSLCYKSASDDIAAPIITAHFTGADVKLNPSNTFVRVEDGVFCLAFSPSESMSIYGNVAQMNFLVGYDTAEKTVSFKPTDCTKP